ncbi:type II toxin-antitoxin system HipA family toxin [Microbulbifer sp.]|uniref:type II toxin-antitoxin system HipA family toxin n=1 Tax=Microbulbifer sp. TaxID=1908541 RepID=UPI003F360B0A
MAHKLEVWLFADHVGTLALNQGRLQFQYAAEWLQHSRSVPLSCSLPLQAEAFDDNQARPFFAGLLPEGRLRRLIAQRFHVSTQNDFALLDRIGGECAGAVTFLEPGQSLPPAGADEVQWLGDGELIELLDRLPRRPMLAGEDGLRLSLAGAQDKLPVVVDSNRIGLPLDSTPSTHILKPAIDGVEDSVTNEGFCLALAAALGLQAAPAQIGTAGGRRYLLVERYDRKADAGGVIRRLHQEDFCQALGVVPEMKYQNEGGPGLAQCFALLRRSTRPAAPQVLRLLDAVIFNTLIGNHDAHAKNFSLLYTGEEPVLAPLYDTLATAVYPELTSKMAMKISSKYKFSEVQPRHWEQFAASAGLAGAQTRKRVVELAGKLPAVAHRLQAQTNGGFSGPLVERIVDLIEQRAALTIHRLSKPKI